MEVDRGRLEEELRNKVGVNASPQELGGVHRLAEDAGVKVTARGGAVVGLYGDAAGDRLRQQTLHQLKKTVLKAAVNDQ